MSTSTLFIKVCQDMPDHPKIADLTDGAFRALVSLWCYCAKYQTDGAVTARRYAAMTTPETGQELLDAGCVEVDGDGFYMHDYLDHQQSKAELDAVRKRRSEQGRKGGLRSAQVRWQHPSVSDGLSHGLTDSSSNGSSAGSTKHSSEIQAEVEVETEVEREVLRTSLSAPTRAKTTPIPPDWQPTPTHHAYAAEHHLDLTSEAFKFRNHAIANDRRQARWDATFTTWLAKARDYAQPKPSATRKPGLPEGW